MIDYKSVDWRIHDAELSKILGVSRQAVGKARKRHSEVLSKKPIMSLDYDGYPTNGTLRAIKSWSHVEGFERLLDAIDPIWAHYGLFSKSHKSTREVNKDRVYYRLVTGGWSGNESIISALQANRLFWAMCWYSSTRGGVHEFYLP